MSSKVLAWQEPEQETMEPDKNTLSRKREEEKQNKMI